MPQIVTHIPASHRAENLRAARRARLSEAARVSDAYRRRLAALRTRAPDTLRARVRRELRAAAESIAPE